MLFATRGPLFAWESRKRAQKSFPVGGGGDNIKTGNLRVQYAMRVGVPVASPQLRVGELTEMLRVSSYHGVPVGSSLATNQSAIRFAGWVSEADVSRALVNAPTESERKAVLQAAIAEVPGLLQTPESVAVIHPGTFVSDASRQMDETGHKRFARSGRKR